MLDVVRIKTSKIGKKKKEKVIYKRSLLKDEHN